jgi:predicted nucleotidyltransferase
MFTQESLLKYIHGYIKACNDLCIYFNKVILFGSYAKKTAHEYSDIDLALVSDDFSGSWPEDRDRLAHATALFYNIEPRPYSTDYFEKGDPFIDEIKQTGIELKVLETV